MIPKLNFDRGARRLVAALTVAWVLFLSAILISGKGKWVEVAPWLLIAPSAAWIVYFVLRFVVHGFGNAEAEGNPPKGISAWWAGASKPVRAYALAIVASPVLFALSVLAMPKQGMVSGFIEDPKISASDIVIRDTGLRPNYDSSGSPCLGGWITNNGTKTVTGVRIRVSTWHLMIPPPPPGFTLDPDPALKSPSLTDEQIAAMPTTDELIAQAEKSAMPDRSKPKPDELDKTDVYILCSIPPGESYRFVEQIREMRTVFGWTWQYEVLSVAGR